MATSLQRALLGVGVLAGGLLLLLWRKKLRVFRMISCRNVVLLLVAISTHAHAQWSPSAPVGVYTPDPSATINGVLLEQMRNAGNKSSGGGIDFLKEDRKITNLIEMGIKAGALSDQVADPNRCRKGSTPFYGKEIKDGGFPCTPDELCQTPPCRVILKNSLPNGKIKLGASSAISRRKQRQCDLL
ncbi:MAG: hypothetical protein AAGA21_22030 [Pseudomonadota bacterium]